jgi:hypothetical protein
MTDRLDEFLAVVTPELEREIDAMIDGLPAEYRAAARARRERLVRDYRRAVEIANLRHRLSEVEGLLRGGAGENLH